MNDYDRKVKSDSDLMTVLLAGDIGGTKTQLGVYDAETSPPTPLGVRCFKTLDFKGLSPIVEMFLGDRRESVAAACFGVAGPVRDQAAQLTNIPWRVEADALAKRFNIPHVWLLNDLAATGYAVSALGHHQLEVLQAGNPSPAGNAALIAPGTGLGEALLQRVAGRFIPVPSEAGHADFAARTSRELDFVRTLTSRRGRVSNEDVLTGPGLINLYRFVHGTSTPTCRVLTPPNADDDLAAAIAASGIEGRCRLCVEALELFVSALGAEAGNLGLRTLATGGVYLAGGIPRKILPALRTPTFLEAFRSKAPMLDVVENIPVSVVTEPDTAVLGAAIAAQQALTDGGFGL
jgi:glucokinase